MTLDELNAVLTEEGMEPLTQAQFDKRRAHSVGMGKRR